MGMSAHQRIRRAMEEKKKAAVLEQRQASDIDKMLVNELKEYAKANNIDISGLNKKEDIRVRILEFKNGIGKNGDKTNDKIQNDYAQYDNTEQANDSTPDENVGQAQSEVVSENGSV